ncbi:hypothetical protein [Lacinutrix sp. Hel_I_90]|uniref:hypothetical protein n=1 Tax=Lacinutrix sp. Hel_I_90 TaxID=1249999 RepID=UPI000B2DC1D4|nr:hypothetical protein [Lacinutrix sp. Hel_I_90]
MTKEVIITVTAPCECTDEQFTEWIYYSTGYLGSISIDNPLHEYDMDADDVTV